MAKRRETAGTSEESAWWQQGLSIPRDLAKVFKAEAETAGAGGVKTAGTAAIAFFLGAPPRIREAMTLWVTIASRKDPQLVTPEAMWQVFQAAMSRDVDLDVSVEWFVTRILDPEVTPDPGKKKSDREGGNSGRKAS